MTKGKIAAQVRIITKLDIVYLIKLIVSVDMQHWLVIRLSRL